MNPVSWYSDPERELLRREVAWARRWLFGGPGLKWLILYVILSLTCLFLPLTGLIRFGIWYHILRRRTLNFFSKERARDLLLTRLDGRNLWPALIAAPIFTSLVLGMISSVGRFFVTLAWLSLDVASSGSAVFRGPFGNYAFAGQTELMTLAQTAIFGLMGPLQWIAVTAYVARITLPKGGDVRLVVSIVVGWMLLKLPVFAPSIGLWFYNMFSWTFAGNLWQPILLWGPALLGTLAAWLVYAFSIRSLRGAKFRRQLERLAQAGS